MKEVTSITIPNGIEISVDFRTAAWLSICWFIIFFLSFFFLLWKHVRIIPEYNINHVDEEGDAKKDGRSRGYG